MESPPRPAAAIRRRASARGGPRRALLPWASWALVVVGAALAVAAGGDPSRAQQADDAAVDAAVLARGGQVYALYCATCHGTDGAGAPGSGVTAGPPLRDTDAAYNDLLVRTGRMPIVEEEAGILQDPLIGDRDRTALVAWMTDAFDLPGAVPAVAEGDAARGHDLYAQHCAACHGATGSGGIASDGVYVRAVRGIERVAVVEAIRVGPFGMPRFDQQVLSERDAADIATFTSEGLGEPPSTPLSLTELNRVSMAVFAAALGLVALGVVFLVSRSATTEEETAPATSSWEGDET